MAGREFRLDHQMAGRINQTNSLRVLALSELRHQKRTSGDFDKLSMLFMLNFPNRRISPWFSTEDRLSRGGQDGISGRDGR